MRSGRLSFDRDGISVTRTYRRRGSLRPAHLVLLLSYRNACALWARTAPPRTHLYSFEPVSFALISDNAPAPAQSLLGVLFATAQLPIIRGKPTGSTTVNKVRSVA